MTESATPATAEKPAKAALPKLEDFPVQASDTVRYGDTDKLGHVNNAVFSTFLETGRTRMLLDPGQSAAPDGMGFALVRVVLDYRAEIHWPGTVEMGTRVLSIGRSSFTLSQAVFQNGVCVATAETVLVLFDLVARRAVPLPETTRDMLARYI